MLEKTLESPLDSKEIKPDNSTRKQLWIFTGRSDAEAEAPILWPSDAKRRLTRKDPDAGKDCGQKKGATEDEMVGWHRRLMKISLSRLHETVKDGEAWSAAVHGGHKELDTTERLNNNHHPLLEKFLDSIIKSFESFWCRQQNLFLYSQRPCNLTLTFYTWRNKIQVGKLTSSW